MKKTLLLLSFIVHFSLLAQTSQERLNKNLGDDNSKFTNIGNIGLTLTNFGTYGHGFSKWPEQPSCEYPIGSGIEHIFDGGLWIGGYVGSSGEPFVTTGAVDAASISNRGGGFEYTNGQGDRVIEKSSLLDSKNFSPFAVSHQDLVMDYSDTNKFYLNGEIIVDHKPLGISVHQESYAWDFPFANFFVIMNYTIKNVSDKNIDSLYVGLWTDTVVRNTNITSPRTGGAFYNKGGNGYGDSLKIAYEFDATGDVGFSDSYIGIQFLGASQNVNETNFVSWQFRNTDDVNFFTPLTDVERYRKLKGFFSSTSKLGDGVSVEALKLPSNRSILISSGKYNTLQPGDSLNVVFAIVAAKKYGTEATGLDTDLQKTNLYANAGWALRAYKGEDRNGNGILDSGEDSDGDGEITRFILPAPPITPRIKVVPENQKVTIYWDKRAEQSIDPISGKKDFEGYRLYKTNSGYDLTASQDLIKSLIKIAEFDSAGNDIGYNTGFDFIKLNEPKIFTDDTTKYEYMFEIDGLLNGWQYVYSVTAYDEGDQENNMGSLESSRLSGASKVLPGTPATSEDEINIGVYPNPYYGEAFWDGSSERLRKIYFNNLPEDCKITIYTLSGDIVKVINHQQASNGSDLRWFETFSKDGQQQMSGGEHAWDLISSSDQAIATGLYLFTVKDNDNGKVKRGKFLVIK